MFSFWFSRSIFCRCFIGCFRSFHCRCYSTPHRLNYLWRFNRFTQQKCTQNKRKAFFHSSESKLQLHVLFVLKTTTRWIIHVHSDFEFQSPHKERVREREQHIVHSTDCQWNSLLLAEFPSLSVLFFVSFSCASVRFSCVNFISFISKFEHVYFGPQIICMLKCRYGRSATRWLFILFWFRDIRFGCNMPFARSQFQRWTRNSESMR